MPYAAINDVKKTLEHDHAKAREMVVEVEHEGCGTVKVVNTPVKWSGLGREQGLGVRSAPPMLGAHTEEILKGLGMDAGEVKRLREEGAVA